MVNCQEYTELLRSCSKQYQHLIGHLKTPHGEPGSVVAPNAVESTKVACWGSSLLAYFAGLFFKTLNMGVSSMSFVLTQKGTDFTLTDKAPVKFGVHMPISEVKLSKN